MRQVWIEKFGSPDALVIRETADPSPLLGTVRIRVEAAGVNFADILGRMGLYPDLPKIPVVPGYEVAGHVDAVGAGVDTRWIGRDVFALTRFGGYSDVVCVPEDQVFVRPDNMSAFEGAALAVNYLTAWQLVVVMGGLKRDETMLVHSAGGGVGIAATQVAKNLGAIVIGTASGGKHETLRRLGVDHLIDYRTEDFHARTMAITHGRGVDLVLDAIGGSSFRKSYRALSATGRLGMFGVSSSAPSKDGRLLGLIGMVTNMPWFTFNPVALINGNKGVFGVNLGRLWTEVPRIRTWADEILKLYCAGVIRPKVSTTFPMERAADAHHFVQDRKNIGKVLLTM